MTRDQLIKGFGIQAATFEWNDAEARMSILEAEAREALAKGYRMIRVRVKKPAPVSLLLPVRDIASSVLLGPDGRPIKGVNHA
jgi:hypothetical protein